MKKRQANFEVLRVAAMAMIVAMHFMNRGNILKPLTEDTSAVNCAAWAIEAFCIVAANCYVLIAGYFMVTAEWKAKKVWTLLLQILFYSLLIPLLCMIFNIGTVREWSVYEWITAVLPLQMDHYWFATAYMLVFVLSPVLAAGVKQLSGKQLKTVIGVLLIYFCLFKTIVPLNLATDRFGYDFPWFICMFLIAAYIRLYGDQGQGIRIGKISLFRNKKSSGISYVLLSVLIFLFSLGLGAVNRRVHVLDHYMNMVYSYNHILVLLSSLALFYVFLYWKPKEGKFVRSLTKIAPYTFGVYLLHENVAVRNLWTGWFGVEKVESSFLFIPLMAVAIAVVMAVGMTVDFIRKKLFSLILK